MPARHAKLPGSPSEAVVESNEGNNVAAIQVAGDAVREGLSG